MPTASDSISFALGAEYRDYKGEQASDLLSQSGDLGGGGSAAPNILGGYDVMEGVVEVAVPLIQGRRLVEDLSLEAGYRYSDYEVKADGASGYSTDTYKLGLSWAPSEDVRFRATFARESARLILRAVRPVITQLQSSRTPGLLGYRTNSGLSPQVR